MKNLPLRLIKSHPIFPLQDATRRAETPEGAGAELASTAVTALPARERSSQSADRRRFDWSPEVSELILEDQPTALGCCARARCRAAGKRGHIDRTLPYRGVYAPPRPSDQDRDGRNLTCVTSSRASLPNRSARREARHVCPAPVESRVCRKVPLALGV